MLYVVREGRATYRSQNAKLKAKLKWMRWCGEVEAEVVGAGQGQEQRVEKGDGEMEGVEEGEEAEHKTEGEGEAEEEGEMSEGEYLALLAAERAEALVARAGRAVCREGREGDV